MGLGTAPLFTLCLPSHIKLSAMLDKKIMKEARPDDAEVYVSVGVSLHGDCIKWGCDVCHYRTYQVLIMHDLFYIHALLMQKPGKHKCLF